MTFSSFILDFLSLLPKNRSKGVKYFKLLIFLTSTKVMAQLPIKIPQSECSQVDIRDSMNNEMKEHFTTPKNQGNLGWCYAFTAADLISAEIQKPISSKHISAIYNQAIEDKKLNSFGSKLKRIFSKPKKKKEKIFELGHVEVAIKKALDQKNLCHENDLPFDASYNGATQKLIESIEYAKDYISTQNYDNDTICNELIALKEAYPINIEYHEIYSILNNNNINSAFKQIIEKNCKNKETPFENFNVSKYLRKRVRPDSYYNSHTRIKRLNNNAKIFFKKIDNVLTKGKPLGISYELSNVTIQGGKHSSVLTGRRWKDGSCQFKIRNTWGESCAAYNEGKIKECISEEGSFWVDEKTFYKMVYKLTYID